MKKVIFFALIATLSSCLYTKQAAIRKFCVPTPVNIDSTWKINGVVLDSAHTGSFFLKDSCDVLRMLYDSLVAQGSYIIDTPVYDVEPVFPTIKDSTTLQPRKSERNKWAVIYKDSVVVVKFRLSKSGQFQFDVEKLQREIPYQAKANFKRQLQQPCPPPPDLPRWHKWVTYVFGFLVVWFAVSLILFFALKR